jgi:2,3-dihydroxybenzoate-AMP ligase
VEVGVLFGCVSWPDEVASDYRRLGYWRGERLGDIVRKWARADGDRTAVVAGDRRVSYSELDSRIDRLTEGFARMGLGSGDRIVVQLPNTLSFLEVCVALFRLGAVPVLALTSHRRSEIEYLCAHTEALAYVVPDRYQQFDYRTLAREVCGSVPTIRHVLVDGEAAEFVALADAMVEPGAPRRPQSPPDPQDVAFFLLSGGTTGLPKLIPRTHDDYAFQLRATADAMWFDERGSYLAALPMAHNAALGCPGVLGALSVGAKVVLTASPSPDEVFPLIAREQVTLTTLVPAYLTLWTEAIGIFAVDMSRLVIEVGGARLDPGTAAVVQRTLGCQLSRWFGMAEGMLSFTRLEDPEEVVSATEGRPLCPADELRIVDESDHPLGRGQVGELLVRGPYTIRGYYKADDHNARAFTADGFLYTGDLARITPAGHLVIEGRTKDIINRGGEKVPAEELEAHLRTHPGVRDAAVVAVPDRVLGEKICACIIPTADAPDARELRRYIAGRGLADYKLPDRVWPMASFPLTPLGKVDKKVLRHVVASGA